MAGRILIYIPNIITVLRILLVMPIGWLMWQDRYPEACILMVVAGVSDAIDGYLARRFNWMTKLGATLDPLADKLLVAVVFIVFTLQGLIPLWIAIIVLVRDFVIVTGATVYKLLYEEIKISPTFLSKANTAVQLVTLILLMIAELELGQLSDLALQLANPWCFYALAILGVSSGVDYVIAWGNKAFRESKKRRRYSLRKQGS